MVFQRYLKVAQVHHEDRDVTIKSVLSQSVTSIPTSLFNEDGTLRKTTKSDLIHELKSIIVFVSMCLEYRVHSDFLNKMFSYRLLFT